MTSVHFLASCLVIFRPLADGPELPPVPHPALRKRWAITGGLGPVRQADAALPLPASCGSPVAFPEIPPLAFQKAARLSLCASLVGVSRDKMRASFAISGLQPGVRMALPGRPWWMRGAAPLLLVQGGSRAARALGCVCSASRSRPWHALPAPTLSSFLSFLLSPARSLLPPPLAVV